jgi:hypothetical protein
VGTSGGGIRNGIVIVDYGGLAKGTGLYEDIITQNGGVFAPGNSPGTTHVGQLAFGPGGVNHYQFEITDAAGTAGHAVGWDLVITDDFTWAADAANPLTVSLQTLTDMMTPGTMGNFDPNQSYRWAAVQWTGAYTGPTDAAALNAATVFDTSGFANAFGGTFGWELDLESGTLCLAYTPAP